jgi:hypothetical protein
MLNIIFPLTKHASLSLAILYKPKNLAIILQVSNGFGKPLAFNPMHRGVNVIKLFSFIPDD